MTKLPRKKDTYRKWKKGLATKEKCGKSAWACRNGVRKTKAQLDL